MAEFKTRIVAVDAAGLDHPILAEASVLLRAGQLVAFPTETVYGLGADALNSLALRRIYEVKGRPSDNPLILHVAHRDQLALVAAVVPTLADALIDAFWPGPLSLVLAKSWRVPDQATGGLTTVAVRMPAHPVALALISRAQTPLAAPSANRSGRPSPTTAQHVFDDLQGRIPLILDAGPTSVGVESTVLDVTGSPPVLLRPGGVSRDAIEAVIGPVRTTADAALRQRSPGTRYRHYSPKARVLLLQSPDPAIWHATLADARQHGRCVGCLLYRMELGDVPPGVTVIRAGSCLEDYARALFSALRALDAQGVDIILVEGVTEEGIGLAIMDRLRRAASPGDA